MPHVTMYRMGEAAALLGVSVDTLRRWTDAGRLAADRDEHGQRRIEGVALAALARTLGAAELEVGPVVAHSARNRFAGIVTRVVRGDVAAQVEIQSGPHRLVSLLTREAVDELGLTEGSLAVAAVKATNVTVELPAGSR